MTIPSVSNGTADTVWSKTVKMDNSEDERVTSIPWSGSMSIDIIDIRHDAVEMNLKEEILKSLKPQSGPKTLPTLLLYDERGLQLFEKVCLKYHVPR
jgi:hypothetical protein